MQLVENWQQSWKWISVQAAAAIIAVSTTWAAMPADLKTPTLTRIEEWAVVILGACAMFGRLINQSSSPSPGG